MDFNALYEGGKLSLSATIANPADCDRLISLLEAYRRSEWPEVRPVQPDPPRLELKY